MTTPMQLRSDMSHEEDLDGCLTVQALQFGMPSSTANNQKPTKQKSIKREKGTRALDVYDSIVASLGKRNTPFTQRLQQQQPVPHCLIDQGTSDGYYVTLGSDGHIGSSSQGVMASPMSIVNQCSPSVVPPQVATCHYRQFSKLPTLPVTSAPTYTSALIPPSNHLYTADPASQIQTNTYSHMPEGACTMQPVPYYPPPNYTEATAMTGDMNYHGHLPPNYDSIMSTRHS